MAISFVSVTDSVANTTAATTLTTSVVVSAGTNRLLVCCVQQRDSGAQDGVTGVTFNGSEAFSKVRHDSRAPGAVWRTEIWYLIAPSVTTANVVVTWAGGAVPDQAQACSIVYLTGVDQSSPVDAQNGGGGAGTTLSCSVTTVAADAWIVDSAIGQDDGGLTVGSGQTARTDRMVNTGGTNEGVGVSTVNGKASPGAETMDWTQGSGIEWCMSAVSFKPASTVIAVSGLTSSLLLSSRLKRSFLRG